MFAVHQPLRLGMQELADSFGIQFMETSAKNAHNVEQAHSIDRLWVMGVNNYVGSCQPPRVATHFNGRDTESLLQHLYNLK